MSTLTVDIGGTKIAAAVVDDQLRVGPRHLLPTPATRGARAVLEAAVAAARLAAWDEEVDTVGLSVAGVVDSSTGAVTHATDLIAGWAGAVPATAFETELGLPVHCLNDVHAHALGESTVGAGRGRTSMLLVAIGTGIGGAHVLDGQVIQGVHGAAGHLGHIEAPGAAGLRCSCGRIGHLEPLASGSGVMAAFLREGGIAEDGARLAALARESEPHSPLAKDVLARAGRATGAAIGSLLNVLDPEIVVLSGGLVDSGDPWLIPLKEGVRLSAMDVVADTPVVAAQTAHDAPHIGAAVFARQRSRGGDAS